MERIGGMALDNGVLLATDSHWAAAVRDRDGAVSLAGGPKPVTWSSHRAVDAVPVLRGPLRMVDTVALMVEVRRRLPKARLPYESARVLGAFVASVLAVGAVRGLPAKKKGSAWLTEAVVAALSVAPALVALRGTALAGYHGAEHKTIAQYELREKGVDPAAARKEHERCGTNAVVPLLGTNALLNGVARRAFRQPPPGVYAATGALSLGVALEAIRWSVKHPESRVSGLLSMPGRFLQERFTTREPTEAQMEVAQSALQRLLEEGGCEPGPQPRKAWNAERS